MVPRKSAGDQAHRLAICGAGEIPQPDHPSACPALEQEAKRIGEQFLALEKFVNLNYLGFHKIVKKHDKQLPHAPCRQFYLSHLHQQPWIQARLTLSAFQPAFLCASMPLQDSLDLHP